MFEVNGLTEKELYEKQEMLMSRLAHMSRSHQYGTGIYTQCFNWLQELEREISDRMILEDSKDIKSGIVATIGEPVEKEKTDGKESKRQRLRLKRRT